MTETTTTTPAPKNKALAVWEDFQVEINNRADELASQLPSNVSRERFINASIAAVKQTPDILKATPRSLFAAITKAAQDGLVPDGREGIITVYGGEAKWNPMIYGLRKRARELDDIIVDAQVIREKDEFAWEAGDTPRLTHRIKIGDRGPMIGAYAIFKNGDEGILHREVMDADQIAKVREQSNAKDSLMWTKFDTEAWRKTVARRGFKSVPCSAPLERLVQRDDDMFAFEPKDVTPPSPPEPPEPPMAGSATADENGAPDAPTGNGRHTGETPEDFIQRINVELRLATDEATVNEIFATFEVEGSGLDDLAIADAEDIKAQNIERVNK